jgi:hypothetical protein
MAYSFTEHQLKLAVINADRILLNALPGDEAIEHEFSSVFERKMRALIRMSYRRNRSHFKKRLVTAIAAILLLIATAMSVSAVRHAVFDFIALVYEKFTHFYYDASKSAAPSKAPDSDFVLLLPGFIPEGFEIETREFNKGTYVYHYKKGEDYITYYQRNIEGVSMDINTEGLIWEQIEFNGVAAKYYSNQGVQNLIWYDDNYMFMILSTLDRDTVFKIAESVNPIS